ncbi:hypothetical protein A7U58_01660 [Burkholderia pseudomallei]|nr:hypothetical protein A7U58_01660 [Burkholderia pseudomallei]ANW54958.1 hypothetical protein A7U59_01670 [Burkholderia pseudomallei]
MAAARQAFAGVQRVFGGGRQTLVERRGEDATNVPRMSGGMHAGDARSSARPLVRSSARPLVRRARGACRCGALRHAGRVASAQPAACAGK